MANRAGVVRNVTLCQMFQIGVTIFKNHLTLCQIKCILIMSGAMLQRITNGDNMCLTVYWKEKRCKVMNWYRPYCLDIHDWEIIFNRLYKRDNEFLEIYWERDLIFRMATYTGV